MNEGHAALLALGLLEDRLPPGASLATATEEDRLAVAAQCVFTTHTPVPAGHDQFGLDQMYAVLGDDRSKTIERFGGLHNNLMNMTYVALRFSRWVNGDGHAAWQSFAADVPGLPRRIRHERRACGDVGCAPAPASVRRRDAALAS